ncbi:MAG: isoprenylcysteine carboxyl methyltransferase [Acidobacteria bacterium]|nr:isoprenylcysteine carboxyl methyltransferase [Acidobacteriota bacterium]
MFVLLRAVTWTTLFAGLVVIGIPARMLTASGTGWPEAIGVSQAAGVLLAVTGVVLAAWCTFAFVFVGKGTPAPFDPPRQLVVGGPYRFARNPMYIGVAATLTGTALFYQSIALLGYAAVFITLAHLLVVGHEEPAVGRRFPHRYPTYWQKVRRWGFARRGRL